MTILRGLPVLLTTLAIGACTGPSVTYQSPRQQQIEGLYQYGAAGRDIPLVVTGNPFGAVPDAEVAAQVERGASRGSMLQPATRPRLHPDESIRPGYQLMVALQPALTVDGNDLCRGTGAGTKTTTTEIRVEMAFCVSGRAYSFASGRTEATGPGDPRFDALISQLSLAVFRQDEPISAGSGDSVAR